MVQCRLRADNVYTIGWLHHHPSLDVGSKVRLQGDDTWWTVIKMSRPVSNALLAKVNKRGWHNNI